MQIQRIQTLYLLLAVVCVTVTFFMPVAYYVSLADPEVVAALLPIGELALAIPMGLTALMLLIDIFLYNDLRLQRRVLNFSMLFTVLDAAIISYIVFSGPEGYNTVIGWSSFLLLGALAFEIFAKRGIDHDRDLLESANRLR
ncbi:MAG: DUF4293 domain-containing protein [Duncaniella sp.]|nr:DUF4293 domain-containing protein [Duncaniella sp.]